MQNEKLRAKMKENKTFVIKFDGDRQAKEVDSLKKEVSAILSIANNKSIAYNISINFLG